MTIADHLIEESENAMECYEKAMKCAELRVINYKTEETIFIFNDSSQFVFKKDLI